MTPEFIYFIKINTALIVFYAFYRLFFYKDTFFSLRRFALLLFFVLGFLYPLMNFHDWIKQQEPISEVIQIYSAILPEIIIEQPAVMESFSWQQLGSLCCKGIYGIGVIFFILRFFIQLGSIVWIRSHSLQTIINGVKVYALNQQAGPFSFFNWIFIHPESHSQEEADEILIHELTHVRQWHSIDVMFTELICIICWINPFVWLLKREVRHNLEYLADNTVLQSGYDSRNYQYHLLGLAHHPSAGHICNNFNMLDLKNRIHMMNKKRSSSVGRTKYFLFVPLTAFLMLISNIESVARTARDVAGSIRPTAINQTYLSMKGRVSDPGGKPLGGTIILSKDGKITTTTDTDGTFNLNNVPANTVFSFYRPGMIRREVALRESSDNIFVVLSKAISKQDNPVFTVVEEMPLFPGGDMAMLKYISQSIKYPPEAVEKGLEGRVVLSFVVNEDGSISRTHIVRGIDPLLDREAERVVNMMPHWTPAKQKGEDVAVMYTLPIVFRLQ